MDFVRQNFIRTTIKNYKSEHPIEWTSVLEKIKLIRQEAKDEWQKWEGKESDEFFSQFTNLPVKLWDTLNILKEPDFLETYEERKWFAKEFPVLIIRNKKQAMKADYSQKLQGL